MHGSNNTAIHVIGNRRMHACRDLSKTYIRDIHIYAYPNKSLINLVCFQGMIFIKKNAHVLHIYRLKEHVNYHDQPYIQNVR